MSGQAGPSAPGRTPGPAGLGTILARGAAYHPDRPALRDGGVALTYGDLYASVRRRADRLVADGLRPGERVAVLMDNRAEWLEHFFAVLLARGVVVPLNYYSAAEEVEAALAATGVRRVVVEERYAALLRPDRTGVTVVPSRPAGRAPQDAPQADRAPGVEPSPSTGGLTLPDRLSAGGPTADRTPGVEPSPSTQGLTASDVPPSPQVLPAGDALGADVPLSTDPAVLQLTSGTAGRPKAIVHTHATVMRNFLHQLADLGIDRSAVTLVVPSLAWGAGLHDLTLATLWAGGAVVLHPSRGLDPAALLASLAEQAVTHVFLAPSVLRKLAAAPLDRIPDLGSLRVVLTGGEPLDPGLPGVLTERFGPLPIRPSYGLSEFPSTMTVLPEGEWRTRPGSVGRATGIATLRVLDDRGRPLPAGRAGQLVCRSPATMTGYDGDPQATAEVLKDGWLRTGDLAVVDADGYVTIVGRMKDMLISGGLNVHFAEVEAALLAHRDVLDAAVVGRPHPQWGEVPLAHVVLAPGSRTTPEQLTAFLTGRLAAYKRPHDYVVHREPLPRNAAGKLLRARLGPAPSAGDRHPALPHPAKG